MKTIVVLAMALMPLALSAPSASEVSLLLQKYSAFAKESSRSLSRVMRDTASKVSQESQESQPNQSSTPTSTALPSQASQECSEKEKEKYIGWMVKHIERVGKNTLFYYGCDVFNPTTFNLDEFNSTVNTTLEKSSEFAKTKNPTLYKAELYNYTLMAEEVAAKVVSSYQCANVTPSIANVNLSFEDCFKAAQLASDLPPWDPINRNVINMAADFLDSYGCKLQLSTESEKGFTIAFLSTMRDSIWEKNGNAEGKDILREHMVKLIEKVGCQSPDSPETFKQVFNNWFFSKSWSVLASSGVLTDYLDY